MHFVSRPGLVVNLMSIAGYTILHTDLDLTQVRDEPDTVTEPFLPYSS